VQLQIVQHLINHLIYIQPSTLPSPIKQSLPVVQHTSIMKTAFAAAATLAVASAQDYNITSKPFQLQLTSEDGKINSVVQACHVGAALESLCLTDDKAGNPTAFDTFNFNTSSYSQPPPDNEELGAQGILTWILPAGNADIPSSVYFNYDPSTNYATPILQPGSGSNTQQLSFDDKDELLVQSYIDNTTNPPTAGKWYGLKRWYACKTIFASYTYENLVWGLGATKPENPTCVPVTVKRVFTE